MLNVLDGESRVYLSAPGDSQTYDVRDAVPYVTTRGFLVGVFCLRNSFFAERFAFCRGRRWLRAKRYTDLEKNITLSG